MSRRSETSRMQSSKPASRQKSGGLEPTRCSCAQRRRRSLLWYTFLACITLFKLIAAVAWVQIAGFILHAAVALVFASPPIHACQKRSTGLIRGHGLCECFTCHPV